MGYYSEVGLMMSPNAMERWNFELNKESDELKNRIAATLSCANEIIQHGKNNPKLWHWNGVKWYDHYFPVSWIERVLFERINEREYRYIVIGENLDDCNEYGCLQDRTIDMLLIRTIHFNIG